SDADLHARPGLDGAVGQHRVEQPAIDDDRLDGGRRILDRRAGRAEELRRVERVQDDLAREVELLERLAGQHTGAVDRLAGGRVLLAHDHVQPAPGELAGGVQPPGAASDNGNIVHRSAISASDTSTVSRPPSRPPTPSATFLEYRD